MNIINRCVFSSVHIKNEIGHDNLTNNRRLLIKNEIGPDAWPCSLSTTTVSISKPTIPLMSRLSLIVRVNVVLNRTVVDSD